MKASEASCVPSPNPVAPERRTSPRSLPSMSAISSSFEISPIALVRTVSPSRMIVTRSQTA